MTLQTVSESFVVYHDGDPNLECRGWYLFSFFQVRGTFTPRVRRTVVEHGHEGGVRDPKPHKTDGT